MTAPTKLFSAFKCGWCAGMSILSIERIIILLTQIFGPILGPTFASTLSSKNTLSSTSHFVQQTKLLQAFPCYLKICHITVVQEPCQFNYLLTLPTMPTVKQTLPHCLLITAMTCVTYLTPLFTLGSLRRWYHHWHVLPTMMRFHATHNRFLNSVGPFTPSTEVILPQPSNLVTCCFMWN